MSYCPECSEPIAKNDVFCPYCGISLKTEPAADDSLSEINVDMSPPVENKGKKEASMASSAVEAPEAEKSPKSSEKQVFAETPENVDSDTSAEKTEGAEKAVGFSAGNTSENWTMKTESVEIPADFLADGGVPFEDASKKDKIEPSPEILPENIDSENAETPASESLKASEPVEEPKNFAEIPTPGIIQDFQFEMKPDEKMSEPETPKIESEAVSESKDAAESDVQEKPDFSSGVVLENPEFTEAVTLSSAEDKLESPSSEAEPEMEKAESFPVVESIDEPKAVDFEPKEFSSSFDEKIDSDSVQPIPEVLENVAESVESAAPELEEQSFQSKPVSATDEKNEVFEPAIEMPVAPFEIENHDEQTKFDSVQIIQKDEVKEEKIEEPEEVKAVAPQEEIEAVVPQTEDAPKEGRPFTTPNMANGDTDGRKTAKLKPLDEGVILNSRYEIVRKIGGGGMGAVYLANDRNLGGVLRAVKEMVQSYIESDQQDKAISDFKRESLLLTSLDHPAIPTIYDYFYDEKEARFYLVMKYISGGDLAGRLRSAPEGRIDEKSVTEWAIQIADVLDYLHNHEPSIVYRDLKPANVMIDGNSGRVMLIDFGIARWVNKEEKGVTAVGTMGYAPPELFSGNVEPRSDIYSLGSTMFHLLTGADPQSNPLLIFDFQKNPRPRQINSQLSDQIERILMRAVEYNAEARFTSAAELREELKEHLTNLQIGKVTYGIKAAPSSLAFSEQSVFCGFCGKQIVATDVFCAFCGAQQPIAQQSFSQSNFIQPVTPKLMIVGTGELDLSSFKLEKTENLIGRRDPMSNIFPEVDLSKYDPQTKISRRHARIWREGNSFLVEDLGSSNGTTLLPAMNDSIRLLPHQPHTLTNGDRIKLGDTTLHFTIG